MYKFFFFALLVVLVQGSYANCPSVDLHATMQRILEKIDGLEKRIPRVMPGPNFKQIGSKFYFIEHDNKVSWLVASETCRNLHGHLADFRNKEDFDAVRGNLRRNDYWISLNDRETEGKFVTEEGSPPQFTKWHKNEPSNGWNVEDCGQLKYENGEHLMNDRDCTLANSYICEFVY